LVPLRRKPPLVLTLVPFVSATVVYTPLASCTTKVSASRRVTTPFNFIFWPEATVRELVPLPAEFCASAAGATASASAKARPINLTLIELSFICAISILAKGESSSGNFARPSPMADRPRRGCRRASPSGRKARAHGPPERL
jgi:hypothetical protein